MRPARALLIAVPGSSLARHAPRATAASPAAADLRAFLTARFPALDAIALDAGAGREVGRADVLEAFARLRPRPGELFVVFFCGHGLPATPERPYHGWALSRDELSDHDLARALSRVDCGADTVVISDCCYGRGVLHAGPRGAGITSAAARAAQLRWLGAAFAGELRRKVSSPTGAADPPMVCISAAGVRGEVFNACARRLVTELAIAATAGRTYASLRDHFAATAFAGKEFHVDARPDERLGHRVLGLEPAPYAAAAATSACSLS